MKTNISDAFSSVESFIQLWMGKNVIKPDLFLSNDITLSSSHRGKASSLKDVLQHLNDEFVSSDQVNLNLTNVVKKYSNSMIKISGYFYGKVSNEPSVFFGGMIIFTLKDEYIQDIKIQLNWVEGNKDLLSGWTLPLNRLWKPKDPTAVIVSELDSIWQNGWFSNEDNETQIAETWYRYAWALDLADTSLYIQTLTENAVAELPPMGVLKGKREIISTLKAFRMPWPSIQHYGEPIHIEISPTSDHAHMIIGRIIPSQSSDNMGKKIYAAHYQIELHRDINTNWQIHNMKYIPGWISKD